MASQKALMAVARKIPVVIFNVLSTKKPFDLTRNMPAIRPVSQQRTGPVLFQLLTFVANLIPALQNEP
jgi:hypothetical protein